MNDYYTYIYLDPRLSGNWTTSIISLNFEPFYVGKGKGKRSQQHKQRWSYNKTHSHKNHRIKSIVDDGLEPIVVMVQKGLDQRMALDLEATLIKEIGTRHYIKGIMNGPLTNLKTDGDIQNYSDISRRKMSQSAKARIRLPHSEETKDKMRKSNKSRLPEVRERMSEGRKGKPVPIGHSERMSKLHSGKTISDSHKQRLRECFTGREYSDESKRKMTLSQLAHWLIVDELGNEITITDLRQWCKDKEINYQTFYGTLSRDKFHKGFKIVRKLFSPR